jgi:hypothetical protein
MALNGNRCYAGKATQMMTKCEQAVGMQGCKNRNKETEL